MPFLDTVKTSLRWIAAGYVAIATLHFTVYIIGVVIFLATGATVHY